MLGWLSAQRDLGKRIQGKHDNFVLVQKLISTWHLHRKAVWKISAWSICGRLDIGVFYAFTLNKAA